MCIRDRPTSALDPGSTMKVEELMSELKKNYTVVIVTHNLSLIHISQKLSTEKLPNEDF